MTDHATRIHEASDPAITAPWGPADVGTEVMHIGTGTICQVAHVSTNGQRLWLSEHSGACDAAGFRRLPLSHNATDAARKCMAVLLHMSPDQRAGVLCWFCNVCRRYQGPGDYCRCSDAT